MAPRLGRGAIFVGGVFVGGLFTYGKAAGYLPRLTRVSLAAYFFQTPA
jgi:hypothetical protein